MKVKDLMTRPVRTCHPETSLTNVAGLMWETDCGCVPVVDHEQHVLGMITDRDICMATAINHRTPDDLTVERVSRRAAVTCKHDDDLAVALETMRKNHIHRLPVIDDAGHLEGILSLTDFVRAAGRPRSKRGFSAEDLVNTLKIVRAHEPESEPKKLEERA
jgi:CBS domain-containing protein